MTTPRLVVPGATTAVTRRTVLRKAFLAPWHPLVESCWLYALADAQRHTDVAVHHSVLVVSHHHTTVTPSADNLPEFLRRFHRDLSCALHTLLCAERYDAPRELFDDRPSHLMRLMDAPAQASHLVYERLNPPAAGLVDRPEHMPQRSLGFDLWKGGGFIEVDRPPVYFSDDRPKRLRLRLTPPPLLYEAFGGDLERLAYHMQRLTEHGLRALRGARRRSPMGAKALRRLHPWSEPRTLRETGGSPVPTFRFGARGMGARHQRIEGAREVHAFRHAHRATHLARRGGDLEAFFPFGTYAARVHHGAPTEPEPSPGARVALPGPRLEDVQAITRRGRRPAFESPVALLEEVRGAFTDEAADIVADAELDLAEAAPVRPRRTTSSPLPSKPEHPSDPAPTDRKPVVVRHRFDSRAEATARRLIVLRDRRRGRPASSQTRHGSDPPD